MFIETPLVHLRERLTRAPRVVVILGSGLSAVADEILDPVRIPYPEIPGFPAPTVEGHTGALVAGIWCGVEVLAMQGRFHLYEGWSPEEVTIPLRVFRGLGADRVIVTNAAGALRPDLRPGDLMLIADHINLTFRNPLVGTVPIGDRFPDMSDPYDAEIRAHVLEAAADARIPVTSGVYAGVLGPSFETPAELRLLARIGADAVGMSTVPEVLVARALGMKVLGITCITNSPPVPGGGKLSHAEVLQVAAESSRKMLRLLEASLPLVAPPNLATEAAS